MACWGARNSYLGVLKLNYKPQPIHLMINRRLKLMLIYNSVRTYQPVGNRFFANDGSDRNIITASYALPKGFGSLWVNKEKGNIKDDFPMYDSDNYSFGTTLNLTQFWE